MSFGIQTLDVARKSSSAEIFEFQSMLSELNKLNGKFAQQAERESAIRALENQNYQRAEDCLKQSA